MFPFEIHTSMREDDLLALNRIVYRNKRLFAVIFLSVAIAVYAVLGFMQIMTYESVDLILLLIWAMMIVLLVVILLAPVSVRRSVRKQLARQGESSVVYTFFEDRLEDEYSNKISSGKQTVSYAAFVKAREDDARFYFFNGRLTAYVIRKSDMTAEQEEALRGAIKAVLTDKKFKKVR